MSDDPETNRDSDPETKQDDASPDIETPAVALPRTYSRHYRIPTAVWVTPCENAHLDLSDLNWGACAKSLARTMPLAGANMLRTGADGEIALISRLRSAMPWVEPVIAAIERHLTIQNWAGRP